MMARLLATSMAQNMRESKRSGKFYSNNEKRTLKALGLTPAPQSGAGWVVKEDGENEVAMVQLKSTDASSYRLNVLDMKKLEYHAMVSNKVPVFLVQFLQQDKIYAIVDIENIEELNDAIKTGKAPKKQAIIQEIGEERITRKKVQTSKKGREQFFKERSESFGRKK